MMNKLRKNKILSGILYILGVLIFLVIVINLVLTIIFVKKLTEFIAMQTSVEKVQYSNVIIQEDEKEDIVQAETINEDRITIVSPNKTCLMNDCLMMQENANQFPFGYGHIKGYYTNRAASDFGGMEVKCDSFTVTDGSSALLESWRQLINDGNTLQALNENNDLVINLPIDNIDADTINKIKQSNINKQLNLATFSSGPVFGGTAGPCLSRLQTVELIGN